MSQTPGPRGAKAWQSACSHAHQKSLVTTPGPGSDVVAWGRELIDAALLQGMFWPRAVIRRFYWIYGNDGRVLPVCALRSR